MLIVKDLNTYYVQIFAYISQVVRWNVQKYWFLKKDGDNWLLRISIQMLYPNMRKMRIVLGGFFSSKVKVSDYCPRHLRLQKSIHKNADNVQMLIVFNEKNNLWCL